MSRIVKVTELKVLTPGVDPVRYYEVCPGCDGQRHWVGTFPGTAEHPERTSLYSIVCSTCDGYGHVWVER